MDSLEKLARSAFDEMENAFAYFGKIEESMGRVSRIMDNIFKKAKEDNEVAEGGSPTTTKHTPPGVRTGSTADMSNKVPNKAPNDPKKARPWHWDLTPYGIAKRIVDKSLYMIPHKCVKYRCFKDDEGRQYIEFRIVSHSGTSYIASEEFSIPVVDTLDSQVELFDRNIGCLLTVKFQMKDPMGRACRSDDVGKDVVSDVWNTI